MSDFIPNSFQTPNAYVDQCMHLLTPEENMVLTYMVRRIFGFGKRMDAISLTQFSTGTIAADGQQLDYGTGLSVTAIQRALTGLKQFRLIHQVRGHDRRTHQSKAYRLEVNSAKVDFAGLKKRRDEAQAKLNERGKKARASRIKKAENQAGCILPEHSPGSILPEDTSMFSENTELCSGRIQSYVLGEQYKIQLENQGNTDIEVCEYDNVPPRAEPTAVPANGITHTRHPQSATSSRIPPTTPQTQTAPDNRAAVYEFIDASMEYLGRTIDWQMHSICGYERQNVIAFANAQIAKGRSPETITDFDRKWPVFCRKSPETATRATLRQFLQRFDDVLNLPEAKPATYTTADGFKSRMTDEQRDRLLAKFAAESAAGVAL